MRTSMVSALARKRSPDIDVKRRVLTYFVRYPLAADSLEGVVRWRLMDEVVRMNVEETHDVLGWLVAEGYLTKVTSPGSDAIFQLNLDRLADARRFLGERLNPAGQRGKGRPADQSTPLRKQRRKRPPGRLRNDD